ncbi:MAG TPA: adenosylcobinamide-phosphate synthase CbiB [Acidimicrobiia bacterium]|nr:adenosylcobinamide-phosphate synthase CbiB [Acidimicrobiia bacterium]
MSRSGPPTRLVGAAAGLLVDRLVGEPPASWHPVAGFGWLMTRLERSWYADDTAAGAAYTAVGVTAATLAGLAVRSTALTVACSTAGRMLRTTATNIAAALSADDLDHARALLPTLVGRDPAALDASGIAAATIESLAENTVDAVVAPAVWGAVLGAPGAAAHRAVNTIDAMVGHHSERYEHFGRVGARLDDAAAYLPARLTVLLVCASRPDRTRAVLTTVQRDAAAHPSPNAGVAEAAFAAALGLQLGGPTRYADRLESRPPLGVGPRPEPCDIARAVQLADRVELTLAALLIALGLMVATRARRAAR